MIARAATPAGERVQADREDEAVSTFTIISLIVLAAGVAAAGVSFARGPLRARREREEVVPAAAEASEPEPPPPARTPLATAPTPAAPEWEHCAIRLWQGYVKWQFYAELQDGDWLAQSSFFRMQNGRSLEESEPAVEALRTLIDELAAQGWELCDDEVEGAHAMLRRRAELAQPP